MRSHQLINRLTYLHIAT